MDIKHHSRDKKTKDFFDIFCFDRMFFINFRMMNTIPTQRLLFFIFFAFVVLFI